MHMTGLDSLAAKVVRSLEFAICNPESEMERPSEWIGNDPDFTWLYRRKTKHSRRSFVTSGNETTQPTASPT